MLSKKFLIQLLASVLLLGFAVSGLRAQIVSSGITGFVRDTAGDPVPGATVTAVHTPTNATSLAVTNSLGRFSISGLPTGGPFRVTSSASGFEPATAPEIYTQLGSDADVLLTLKSTVVQLERFVATASRNDLDASSTGAASVLSSDRIAMQPTVNGSFADLMKTNPFLTIRAGGDRITALGANNRFNSISVDGARINDSFGLNASGLASFNNPFALDALEQFSIELSPYDVRRSGFTGASINAVTKSGTNEFRGSAYWIATNDGLQQPDIIGANAGKRVFNEEETRGFTLGGPILRDRLFFFANFEQYTRDSVPVSPVVTPNAADLSLVEARLAQINSLTGSSVNFGGISGGANRTEDEKRLLKLDWNINRDHRMTLRYSDTVGQQPSFGGLNSTNFSGGAPLSGAPSIGRITALTSNFFSQERTEEVWAGQIFSNWTPSLKTQLAYSEVSFAQDTPTPVTFPEVRIYNFPGLDTNTNSNVPNGVLVFGTENARHGNRIAVDTTTYSATGEYSRGRFQVSGGFDREESSFLNLFRQASYGVFGYNGAAAFVADTPFSFTRSYVQTGLPVADVSAFDQTGFFGQVKTDVSQRLNFTLGLRHDRIGSDIPPPSNAAFQTAFGESNAATIDGTDAFSPRASFNFAFDDERTTQLRGGVGAILGRNPWVWISNIYGATGVGRFRTTLTSTSPTLVGYLTSDFDPASPIGTTNAAPPASVADITFMESGLELPSVLRSNLAVDHNLRGIGATLTLEVIQTNNVKAFFNENINLRPTTVGADGRQRFAGSASQQPRIAGFGNVFRMRNVDAGSSRYFSLALDRPMRGGWAYGLSYTRGQATEAQALGSSTAGSNWQFNAVFNQNAIEVGRSDFEIRDRILANLGKEFRFWRDYRTVVSLFYEGRTGSPYSWVFTSDLNSDGVSNNDLVAVPSGASDSRFDFSALNAGQVSTFLDFFRQNYLSTYAGGYAPRNAFEQPWQNRLDLRVVQEIPVFGRLRAEVFADFINFGSWLSKDLFNYVETLPVPTNTGLVRNFGNVGYNANGQIRVNPATFNNAGAVNVPGNSAIAINNGDSRWRLQFGARIKF